MRHPVYGLLRFYARFYTSSPPIVILLDEISLKIFFFGDMKGSEALFLAI